MGGGVLPLSVPVEDPEAHRSGEEFHFLEKQNRIFAWRGRR